MSYLLTVLTDNPIRYYRLGDSGGANTVAVDVGSQAQNGTISGGVTAGQVGLLDNDIDTAMLFDGASGQVSLPTTGLPTGASPVTLEAWVKYTTLPTPGSGYSAIVYLGSNVNNETFGLYYNTGGKFRLAWAANSLDSANNVATGVTYHVVATYDGTNVNLYVNGVLSAGPSATAQNLIYGVAAIGNDASSLFGSGVIDDVAIYNYALAPSQINDHYQAGFAGITQIARRRPRWTPRGIVGSLFTPYQSLSAWVSRAVTGSFIERTVPGFVERAIPYVNPHYVRRGLAGIFANYAPDIATRLNLTASGTLYYAYPGDDLQAKANVLKPGDTLILKDGTYITTSSTQGLRIIGVNGSNLQPITIKAENDGKAIIDGVSGANGFYPPIFVTNSSFITIQGLVARNSAGSVIQVYSAPQGGGSGPTHDIIIQRCTAHGAGDGNFHCIDITTDNNQHQVRTTNVLVEDCAAWGKGRYMFIGYSSDNVTFRRCYAYWNGINDPGVPEPRAGFGVYGAANVSLENCIARNAIPYQTEAFNNYYQAVWHTSAGPYYLSDNTNVYGCIFYDNYNGYWLNDDAGSPFLMQDTYIEVPFNNSTYTTQDSGEALEINVNNTTVSNIHNNTFRNSFLGYRVQQPSTGSQLFYNNALVGNTTATLGDQGHVYCGFSGNGTLGTPLDPTDSTADPGYDTATYGRGAALFVSPNSPYKGAGLNGTDIGANILYQYKDGVLTNVPLWPWPMESRVVAELGQSPTYETGGLDGGPWRTLNGLYGPATPPATASPQWHRPRYIMRAIAGSIFTPFQAIPAWVDRALGSNFVRPTSPVNIPHYVRRSLTNILINYGLNISTRFRLMSANVLNDISTRFILVGAAQSIRDIASRFGLMQQSVRDIALRFRLAKLNDISARFKLALLKDVASRFRLKSADQLKDIASRFRLMSANQLKDIASRFRLKSADQLKDIASRFRLAKLNDIATRFRLAKLNDIKTRFRLMQQSVRDVTTRFRLGLLKDVATRFRLAKLNDIATRFRLATANQSIRDTAARFRLMSANQLKDVTTRFRLARLRDVAARFRLMSASQLKDVRTRLRLMSANQLKDIAARFRLTTVGTQSMRDIACRLVLIAPASAVWLTRDGRAVWVTRDDKDAWTTRDELATWKARL